jgi:hypothetical protein
VDAARPLRPEEVASTLGLWQALGGWYRETGPVGTGDAAATLERVADGRGGRGRWRIGRPPMREQVWVTGPGDRPTGFLYGCIDTDVAFAAPFVRTGPDGESDLRVLVAAAGAWALAAGRDRYLVEAPSGRPEFAAVFGARSRPLWHRLIFSRELRATDRFPVSERVRGFRSRDSADVQALSRREYPGGRPVSVPIPFFAVPGSPGARAADREFRIWVLADGPRLYAVCGASFRPGQRTGEIGPFIALSSAPFAERQALLGAALQWLVARGLSRVRRSIPGDDRTANPEVLASMGFVLAAESDLLEVNA